MSDDPKGRAGSVPVLTPADDELAPRRGPDSLIDSVRELAQAALRTEERRLAAEERVELARLKQEDTQGERAHQLARDRQSHEQRMERWRFVAGGIGAVLTLGVVGVLIYGNHVREAAELLGLLVASVASYVAGYGRGERHARREGAAEQPRDQGDMHE